MSDFIASGLYRTTTPMPGFAATIPADVLVYVGERPSGERFVVRPGSNRKNRWFWGEPTLPLVDTGWMWTLRRLRPEGFYTLPDTIELESGGRWLKNAIVQLGYNEEGRAIIFIAEDHAAEPRNVLEFARSGRVIDDTLLDRLTWAPILPISAPSPELGGDVN